MRVRVIVVVLLLIGTTCVVGSFMLNYVLDSQWHRKRVTKRLRTFAEQFVEHPDNEEVLWNIINAAESSYRFERCYALGVLGDLGPQAHSALPVIVNGLRSVDPLVRHCAAQALFDWGSAAAPAKDHLIHVVKNYANESAGMYAAETLGKIGDPCPEVLAALRSAAFARDSLAEEAARESYYELSGTRLPPKP